MPFPRALVQDETHTLSTIRTRATDSTYYSNNHYAKRASEVPEEANVKEFILQELNVYSSRTWEDIFSKLGRGFFFGGGETYWNNPEIRILKQS